AMAAAAGVVFIIALIVVSVITMKLADWIIDSRIGALDRTLGFLYGAARGILVVAVALLFFNWLAGAKAPAWVTEAKSRPLLEQIGAKLESLLPEDPENAILKKLNPNQPAAETPAAPDAPAADAPAADAPAAAAPAGGDDTNAPVPDDNDATPPANNAPAAPAPAAPAN
ncbi:CvpA family protein, partial [Mesorhizobium sp. M7A.F.Ca.CA.001.13.2.1]